jgi:site-specific DNA-methyltransferase (adenine-specific)
MKNIVYNCDCMEFMKNTPDKYYDLAITDPPFFSGPKKTGFYKGGNSKRYNEYPSIKNWTNPKQEYFNELLRISKFQIIFGINYYNIEYLGSGRIIWDKLNDSTSFSDCEIAYTNLFNHVRIFRFLWNGFLQGNKIKEIRVHPTQKPVELYLWLLKNYAKPNDKIFDSHIGSGSIRIACDELQHEFEGCELDKHYFDAQELRFNKYKQQLNLF